MANSTLSICVLTARDLGGEVTPHREALMSVRIAVIAVTFLSLVGQAAAQDEPQDPVLEHLRHDGVREEAREKAGCTGDDSIAMVHCFALFNNCEQIGLIVEDLPASASEIGLTRERLQTLAESRFRAARLYDDADPFVDLLDTLSFLYINVNVVGRAFSTSLEYRKPVFDRASRVPWKATTWNSGVTGTHDGDTGFIVQGVSEHLDRFIVEYLRVNEAACP